MHSRECSSYFSETFGIDPFRLSTQPTPSVDELSVSGWEELLVKFVSIVKKNRVKVSISVGGVSDWTYSMFLTDHKMAV